MKIIKHKHHIIPKHMGGSDDSSNLIELTIEEHALAHKQLWETYHKKEDYVAWKFLLGQSTDPQAWYFKSSLGGKKNKNRKKCYNNITKKESTYIDNLPEGYSKGRSPLYFNKKNIMEYTHDATGSIWYHNIENPSETRMFKDSDIIPSNYIKGRHTYHITEQNKTLNYKFYHNLELNKEITSKYIPLQKGYIKGRLPKYKIINNNLSKTYGHSKNSSWYYNLNLRQERMFKSYEDIPHGWRKGRLKGK